MEAATSSQLWENIIIGIDDICKQFDKTWRRRNRIIDSKLIVTFLFQSLLSKGSDGYATTLFELWASLKGKGIESKKGAQVAPSSMCEARQKLDENIFKLINKKLVEECETVLPTAARLWQNRRIFAVDGSKINLPWALNSIGFNLNNQDTCAPQGLASCLYNLKTKLPHDFTLVDHGDERLAAKSHLQALVEGDCVVYDRGYFGYVLLYEHIKTGIDAVFRLSDGTTFPEIKAFINDRSFPSERIVTIIPTKFTQRDIRKKHNDIMFLPIKLRLIRYRVDSNWYFLGTTVGSLSLSFDHFAELYHSRWGIEEFYKIIKSHLKVENFHSKTVRGIKQELYGSFVLAAITRITTLAVETRVESIVEVKHSPIKNNKTTSVELDKSNGQEIFRVNFKHSLKVLGRFLLGIIYRPCLSEIKIIFSELLDLIESVKSKVRSARKFPRIRKTPNLGFRNRLQKEKASILS
ncbi:MAG TPA: IS4 family transposase [Nostoc sp.]|uniref:IS4 family transposase n=1 Tax=Nostoc sp. TaxID=1180 RepID=UPI002D6C1A9A|nr:IS4 family transposase [Nostoc sp.]HYX15290.1 IS4 family transposase [Nostoc sp.]